MQLNFLSFISLVKRSEYFVGWKAKEDRYLVLPHEPLPSGETVEAAISKVLAAEREARESVVACRRHAEERLEIARREARLISERCERRMQAIRQGHADQHRPSLGKAQNRPAAGSSIGAIFADSLAGPRLKTAQLRSSHVQDDAAQANLHSCNAGRLARAGAGRGADRRY